MNKRNYPKLLTPPSVPGWWTYGAFAVSGVLWGGIIWGGYSLYNYIW